MNIQAIIVTTCIIAIFIYFLPSDYFYTAFKLAESV